TGSGGPEGSQESAGEDLRGEGARMNYWRTTEAQAIVGRTAKEGARILGRSEDAVRSFANKRGIRLARKRSGWPAHKRDRAAALRARGETFRRIGAALGVPEIGRAHV